MRIVSSSLPLRRGTRYGHPAQMRDLVEELKADFDYVLVDCPAGIEQGFKNAVAEPTGRSSSPI